MLVDEYDVDGMAEGMLRYARDPQLAKEHGQAGRAVVAENWTSEKSIGRLWEIIQKAASRHTA